MQWISLDILTKVRADMLPLALPGSANYTLTRVRNWIIEGTGLRKYWWLL